MTAESKIAELLADAQYIAEANGHVILCYLISIAILHLLTKTKDSKTEAA